MDDDEGVLPLEEQTNRPDDDALHQQRIPAWHPILDPVWVIIGLFYLGAILLPVGLKVYDMQDDVVELKVTYDNYEQYEVGEDDNSWTDIDNVCGIGNNFNEGRDCLINVTAPRDMYPPILVHYEIANFHQNHRSYYQSRDDFQLAGQEVVGSDDLCDRLNKLQDVNGNTIALNPCGFVANTMFNDVIRLVSGSDADGQPLQMLEEGIAWQSDIEYLFAQPDDFRYTECPACDASCCERPTWSCTEPYKEVDPVTGNMTCYSYFYPQDDTTQYLHETYPDIVSPLEGVTNEHFIVWMRVATQPTFRKLYGWFDQPIRAGTQLQFAVKANYVVTRFRGSKSLLVGTNNIFGGRNPYFGPLLYWSGVACLIVASLFALKQVIKPRKLADDKYLHFKEE